MTTRAERFFLAVFAALLAASAAPAVAQTPAPASLDQVAVPRPGNWQKFVKSEAAAIRLGKAFFWDMQLGSDGLTACATCHFHAGTDDRTRNTMNPGAGAFEAGAHANADLQPGDFPFHRFANHDDRHSAVTSDRNDVVGAQGVPRAKALDRPAGRAAEPSRVERDGVFGQNARNVRQVTGRNAPSVINAVFNYANFWDGRANHFFNGANPFGIMDVAARVFVNGALGLHPLNLTGSVGDPDVVGTAANEYKLDNASLASQAVGPPPNDVEMSWSGRRWPDIGRKLLGLRPLGRQRVHPADSTLSAVVHPSGTGLALTYGQMIEAAFQDEFWNGTETVEGFSHMEANFALFFGLAVQFYEATLVSDDTPFDRFVKGDARALTDRQVRGMSVFFSGGTSCTFCHVGPEFTAASISQLLNPLEAGLIETMPMADNELASYDIGFYNIGVRPTGDDKGRGGSTTLSVAGVPTPMPLSFTAQYFARHTLPFAIDFQPGCLNNFVSDPPRICPPPGLADTITRQAVDGAFKTPGLRNVELTGPYMHNGGMATLMQVVDFYTRGGDFHEANLATLDPIIAGIGGLQGNEELKAELVDFLLALTDERVRWESAPFDHPQLLVPDGHENRVDGHPKRTRVLADRMREIPAVGRFGRQVDGLPPVKPFLASGLEGQALSSFHFQH